MLDHFVAAGTLLMVLHNTLTVICISEPRYLKAGLLVVSIQVNSFEV